MWLGQCVIWLQMFTDKVPNEKFMKRFILSPFHTIWIILKLNRFVTELVPKPISIVAWLFILAFVEDWKNDFHVNYITD